MNKFLRLFYLISFTIFLTDCSFKNPGNFFEDNQKKLEKEIFNKNYRLVFSPKKNEDFTIPDKSEKARKRNI